MYLTDRQFMRNPATASQRIYIGGFDNQTVIADDLEQKFRQYGKILGLVIQRGFAFIQYETDEDAQRAIRMEQGAFLKGKKITVKPALPDRTRQNPGMPNSAANTKPPESIHQLKHMNNENAGNTIQKQQEPEEPSKTPAAELECISHVHDKEQGLDEIAEKFQEEKDSHKDFPHKPMSTVSSENFDEDDSRAPSRRRGRGVRNNRRGGKRYPPHPPPIDRDRVRGPGPFYPAQDRFLEFEKPPPTMDRPERNDCEIIVVSKVLTEFAEYIESRLKALGLLVDLLFPNEDVPIGRVLANISSRGCLYAILIMPQNKENQSLTLNVLHGIPQEHRNMPIEDALLFITRNFEAYMRGENVPAVDAGSQMTIHDKHPNSLQLLLNVLAENRVLTSIQYDKVIKYLEERRELQVQFEVSEGIEVSSETSVNKQAELQNRIMNILNKSSDVSKPDTEQAPPPPPTNSGPTPLLKDPTVQKALDSLLLGDMFKNIVSG